MTQPLSPIEGYKRPDGLYDGRQIILDAFGGDENAADEFTVLEILNAGGEQPRLPEPYDELYREAIQSNTTYMKTAAYWRSTITPPLKDLYGHIQSWEESQAMPERLGFLDRVAFEQEYQEMRQVSWYKPRNAIYTFRQLVWNHVQTRGLRAASVSGIERTRDSIIQPDRAEWVPDERYACPDWLNALYWEEEEQCIHLNCSAPLGAFFYYTRNSRVYVVEESDVISEAEAGELEEAFDVFDAAGPYAVLVPPRTEEEVARAQQVFASHQRILGGIELRSGVPKRYIGYVLLRGETEKRQKIEKDCWWKDNPEDVLEQVRLALQVSYPEISLLEWDEFLQIQRQRI